MVSSFWLRPIVILMLTFELWLVGFEPAHLGPEPDSVAMEKKTTSGHTASDSRPARLILIEPQTITASPEALKYLGLWFVDSNISKYSWPQKKPIQPELPYLSLLGVDLVEPLVLVYPPERKGLTDFKWPKKRTTLSGPQIMVQNLKQAKWPEKLPTPCILKGEEVYLEVALTPKLTSNSGQMALHLEMTQEVTQSEQPLSKSGDNSPTLLSTTIFIKDGSNIIIGGSCPNQNDGDRLHLLTLADWLQPERALSESHREPEFLLVIAFHLIPDQHI